MIISYFYLIENIKRRRRHDNTEERKKTGETINIIQLINVHKKKPMIRFESWSVVQSKTKQKQECDCFHQHISQIIITFSIKTNVSCVQKTLSHIYSNKHLNLLRQINISYLDFYGNICEYHICGAPPYDDIDGIFFIWSKSKIFFY
jgi:transcriptional regulator NrdR family protein